MTIGRPLIKRGHIFGAKAAKVVSTRLGWTMLGDDDSFLHIWKPWKTYPCNPCVSWGIPVHGLYKPRTNHQATTVFETAQMVLCGVWITGPEVSLSLPILWRHPRWRTSPVKSLVMEPVLRSLEHLQKLQRCHACESMRACPFPSCYCRHSWCIR